MLSKTLLLVGSGEFTPQMQSADSYALSFADSANRNLVILPTAKIGKPDIKQKIDTGIEHFQNLGYDAISVDILSGEDANNQQLIDQIGQPAMVYVAGGDLKHLIRSVKNNLLEKTLKSLYDSGTVMAGNSSGAMLFGTWVAENKLEMQNSEKEEPRWVEGLSFVERTVIPHYDVVLSKEKELYERLLKGSDDSVRNNILGIDEDTALLITDDKDAMVLGKGSVHIFTNGHEEVYYAGSVLTI